ncbi:5-methylcytosine-specific restriction endonuclease McrA [Nocardia pseudobrasiliensis]|uniref:5-methylcytosine-specific restriction endonuclease McrA n=2 Tax=Nocardia pseudobrasiliensis TaxID=45979 RepID=A0A370IC88_9NOCA|nr:5-methylcytosine-specific restriction endonuclease McrA [Nocardia pseudobrasiliensis]
MVTPMLFRRAAEATPDPDNWIHTDVLVLNASYEALTEVGADRAVVLLVSGVAETVAAREPYFPIRSKHLEIALPETIRLLRYVYLEHKVLVEDESRATLAGVLRRDRHRCGYCAGWARTVDHIRPRSRGGPNTWNNLIAACGPCNTRKADRTPEEAGMRLLWEPKAPTEPARTQRRIWKDLAAAT